MRPCRSLQGASAGWSNGGILRTRCVAWELLVLPARSVHRRRMARGENSAGAARAGAIGAAGATRAAAAAAVAAASAAGTGAASRLSIVSH